MKAVAGIIASVLLLSVFVAPAFAPHTEQDFKPTINVPKKGATYSVEFNGIAHIAGSKDYRPASAEMKLQVVSVKATGVPQFGFKMVSGSVTLDGNTYPLERGLMNVQVGKVIIEASGREGPTNLDLFGTLVGPLPLFTSDDPVVILKGERKRSASIRILDANWIYDFKGEISRITLLEVGDIGEPGVGESFKGNFVGGYISDPNFNLPFQPESRNPVFGVGKFSILGKVLMDGVAASNWIGYTSENPCAEVSKELVLRKVNGEALAVLVLKIDGEQCDVLEDGNPTGLSKFTGEFTVLGGAGVLDGARGSGSIEAEIDPEEQTFKGRLDGSITVT